MPCTSSQIIGEQIFTYSVASRESFQYVSAHKPMTHDGSEKHQAAYKIDSLHRGVAVFCGSCLGASPHFAALAADVGRMLAQHGLTVVYGGSVEGLMGIVADSALSAAGRVVGVVPRELPNFESSHKGLTALHVVDSMAERKLQMMALSDVFVVLPGGYGTLDELFEVVTLRHIGASQKPTIVVNFAGFYDALGVQLTRAHHEGFLREAYDAQITFVKDVEGLAQALRTVLELR